ncbi:DDE-type integrase/transposase/recombinase [Enterovibrio norvegicus]|uniref:DDE-type integrase/transposase/recombinase n=1 Tax=Enterovibrio norvegicus TaxID=188144 RepID=UPI0024B1E955|nr:DDE-type integrase/transposase/recombinase [Enterovibrio norvegicus]
MNKEWFTSIEVAELLSLTDRGVRKKAQREKWVTRNRAHVKGCEFHISSLPSTAIAKLAKDVIRQNDGERAAAILASQLDHNDKVELVRGYKLSSDSIKLLNTLPEKDKEIAFARLSIVETRQNFIAAFQGKLVEGHASFISAYQDQTLPIGPKVYELISKVSRATIDRWESTLKSEGICSLTRRKSQRRGDSIICQQRDLEQFCVTLLIARPHFKKQPYKMREYALVQKEKIQANWDIPAASSFRRWIQNWVNSNQGKHTFAVDHKSFYGKERGLIHDHDSWVSQPNDLWEMDSTPTDVMLNVEGKLVRYSIVACIDVFTRRVKMLLAPTSTAEAICLLMRKAILDWGLPNPEGVIKTDNGSDYIANKSRAVFMSLGVKHMRATPFSGWEKPFIERFFGTFQGGVVEVMPNYIGHSVTDRELIEACHAFAARIGDGKKKRHEDALELGMTPNEMQQFMDDWLEHYYHQKPHSGLDGLSPYQQYQNTNYKPQFIPEPRALDALLNFAGEKSIRRGGVQINKLVYRAPELQEEKYMRQRVNVYLDPCDVARAYLYPIHGDGECIEAVNADLIGREISPQAFIEARRKTEKQLRQFKRDMKRYSEEFGIDDLAAEAIAQAKAKNNTVPFPKESIEHNNELLTALEKAGVKSSTERSNAELEAIERHRDQRKKQKERTAEQEARMLKGEREIAWDMADILINGGELDERQQKWFKNYMHTHQLTAPQIQKYIESGGKSRRLAK